MELELEQIKERPQKERESRKLKNKGNELTLDVQKRREKYKVLQRTKPHTTTIYRDIKELQKIIRQSSKERLQLERHLSRATEAAHRTVDVDLSKYVALEQTNQALRHRLEELDQLVKQKQNVESNLVEREEELTQLKAEVNEQKEICADLERQLSDTLYEKSDVEAHNVELQHQVSELERVTKECHQLRNSLEEIRHKYKTAQSDVVTLEGKHMREAAEKRKELDKEHGDALAELQKHQEEARLFGQNEDSEKQQSLEVIKSLESKVRELQKKCELQNVLHEELVLEMATLRRSREKWAWSTQRSHSADVSHGEELHSVQEVDRILASAGTLMSSTYGITAEPLSSDVTLSSQITTSESDLTTSLSSLVKPATSDQLSFSSSSLTTPTTLDSASKEIERILQRIEQDNKLLAELDKPKKTFSSSVPGSPIFSESSERMRAHTEGEAKLKEELSQLAAKLKPSFSSPAIDQLLLEPQKSKQMYSQLARYRGVRRPSVTRRELDLLMAKLEQDDKLLAELDRQIPGYVSWTSSHLSAVQSLFGPSVVSYSTAPPFSMTATSFATPFQTARPIVSPAPVSIITAPASRVHVMATYTCPQMTPTSTYITPQITSAIVPAITAASPAQVDSGMATSVDDMYQMIGTEDDALGKSSVDHIELPGRGHCRVYMARYSYDPLQQSPNENPEAELELSAGDYVLIFGEMDEDGFFSGELLDGRKGLVPSNFVELLYDENLFDFQATVLYGNRDPDDSSASYAHGTDYDFSGSSGPEEMYSLPAEDYHRMNDYIDLKDIEEVDEDDLSDVEREMDGPVPPPQRLILERQLNKSILIGWLPPEGAKGNIKMYHVYVDGILKAMINSSERTRALVEGVDSSQPHRISVQSVTSMGHHSRDAACTITIGKDIPLAPSCIKASNVTSTSAVISWLPSNSNFNHAIAVNNVEIQVVKPGIFRHNITGLVPNTQYKVSIRAKPGKLLYNAKRNPKKLDMLTMFVEFRTLPKGLPDPPVDIQVEAGPQDGTLLVTWLPVTINPTGTSNGVPVTGYAIFAAGKKVAEVYSPTGDHALLQVKDLFPLAKKTVTVRTKSGDSLSSDSMPCVIPEALIKTSAHKSSVPYRKRASFDELGSDSGSESDTELAELVNHVARRSQAFESNQLSPERFQGSVDEFGQYELCDILEEREENGFEYEQCRKDRTRYSSLGNGDVKWEWTRDNRDQNSLRHSVISKNQPQSVDSPTTVCKYVTRFCDRKMNHLREGHQNSAGQLVIEPDDNLSDREIYPTQTRMTIPSIEITKVNASESHNSMENFSEEEYEAVRSEDNVASKSYLNKLSMSRKQVYGIEKNGPCPVSPSQTHHLSREDHNYYEYVPPVSHLKDGISYRDQCQVIEVNHSENSVRWFVALFDYIPHTMSPNPDTTEELPFQEGQLIKIYGDKDPDGYYKGEINGRVGFVPCNMVSEVQMEEEQLLNENAFSGQHPSLGNRDSDSVSGMPLRKMVALYDYDPQELSPNVDLEMELAFNTGDIINVYGEVDEDGFFMGEINGVHGLVPSNFLTDAPPDYRDNRSVPKELFDTGSRTKEPQELSSQ
ncbi:RIMS-binding protein 2-like isoform X3 [Limulus polyphemus]|uniref:RIMS-binding protein 2-like isoform X3 n=1 Tax=Limulus polyphemus TaxID=6850 RepID=A0ABM1SPD3_LIMPO|nr:RIMS-binding protein 2-like isoform X3 [Limulus polyphemus]